MILRLLTIILDISLWNISYFTYLNRSLMFENENQKTDTAFVRTEKS